MTHSSYKELSISFLSGQKMRHLTKTKSLVNKSMLKRSFLMLVCFRKRLYVHNTIVLDKQK